MKPRALSSVLLIVLCVVLAGCGRVWFVDLTKASASSKWIKTGNYAFEPVGLILNDGFVSSLVAFGGDFTVTVEFELQVNEGADRANFAIWLSDGHTAFPDNYITNYGRGLGNPLDEEYAVRDYNHLESEERYIVLVDAEFPGLRRSGHNTWKLYKEGGHITIVMNGTTIVAEFDIEHYQATYFYVNLFGELNNNGLLKFKSVKVVYYDYMLEP